MIALLLLSLAHALPPDDEPGRLAVGAGRLERLAVSADGAWVVGREASTKNGFVVSLESWAIHRITGCQVAGVAVVPVEGSGPEFWAACANGRIRLHHLEDDRLVRMTDTDGHAIEIEVANSLEGLWYHDGPVPSVHAISLQGDFPRVHAVDPDSLAVDAAFLGGYPVAVQTWSGFREAVTTSGQLVLHHTADRISAVTLGANPGVLSSTPTLPIDVADMTPSHANGVYAVDVDGWLAEYLPASAQWRVLLDDFPAPRGVGASLDPDDRWIVVAGSTVRVHTVDGNGNIDATPAWTSGPDGTRDIRDIVVSDGYAFGGGGTGRLHVLTARPWLDPSRISLSPESLRAGEVATLTFTTSQAGTWEVRVGGTREGNGRLLASGEVSAADVGQDVVVELAAEADVWSEGDNDVYVLLTSSRGLVGHARATVFVDTPPQPPKLSQENLTFSDGALLLSFPGIHDEDLERYEIYVSTTPFTPEEWPTGGPPWDGSTKLTTPILVTQAPGEAVRQRIAPLENDVKHYIAVRAYDRGGLEGPMSRVISETPRPTYSASDLAGDEGGTPCSTSPWSGGLLAAAASALLVLRRRSGLLAAVLVAVSALAPVGALAGEADLMTPEEARKLEKQERKKERWRDLTPVYGNFELRYGILDIDDPHIEAVYDGPFDVLMAEVGPQFWRVLELDFGLGFIQEIDRKIDARGLKSGEVTMLTMWPLSLDATFRLHVFDEQPLVPHARFGFDYVLWSEKVDDGFGGKVTTRGAKTGNHVGLGVGLLLDVFARRRASLLEAQTGINDTWLVVEWRRQFVDGRSRPWGEPVSEGLDFSGDMVTAGLKLDF